jgi:L-amino acid N-acyltransferase YncA
VLCIRRATEHDAAAMLEIYRPYVERTVVSFETQAPSVEEFAARIAKALGNWTWLVAEEHGKCVGYAHGSAHRERPAYRWSVETSAYIHDRHHRRGIGRSLYAELLEQLAAIGYCNAYAGIALPNDASIALHRTVGFEPIGVFRRVGRKFGAWQDVAWFHCQLREEPLFPGEHRAAPEGTSIDV